MVCRSFERKVTSMSFLRTSHVTIDSFTVSDARLYQGGGSSSDTMCLNFRKAFDHIFPGMFVHIAAFIVDSQPPEH